MGVTMLSQFRTYIRCGHTMGLYILLFFVCLRKSDLIDATQCRHQKYGVPIRTSLGFSHVHISFYDGSKFNLQYQIFISQCSSMNTIYQ